MEKIKENRIMLLLQIYPIAICLVFIWSLFEDAIKTNVVEILIITLLTIPLYLFADDIAGKTTRKNKGLYFSKIGLRKTKRLSDEDEIPWQECEIEIIFSLFSYIKLFRIIDKRNQSRSSILSINPAVRESFIELINKYAPTNHSIRNLI